MKLCSAVIVLTWLQGLAADSHVQSHSLICPILKHHPDNIKCLAHTWLWLVALIQGEGVCLNSATNPLDMTQFFLFFGPLDLALSSQHLWLYVTSKLTCHIWATLGVRSSFQPCNWVNEIAGGMISPKMWDLYLLRSTKWSCHHKNQNYFCSQDQNLCCRTGSVTSD